MYHKRILVTGATGLLGSNVVAELVSRGFHVRVLLRKSSNTIALAGLAYEAFYGDITDADAVIEAAKGCDVIIHSAANTSQWGSDMSAHNTVNILGTQHVVNAAKRWNAERLIHVSTANTLQPGTMAQPGNENGAFSYGDQATAYIATKREAEELVRCAAQQGVPAVIVNPTFMIGARDAKPSSGKLLMHYLRNPLLVCPPGGKNFVPVRDAAIAIANAIERGEIGERYLLAGVNMTYAAFFKIVAEVTGKHKPTVTTPAWLLKSVGRAGDVMQQFVREPLPFTYANVSLLTIENYYTAAKAVRALDMPQSSLEQAVFEAIQWFEQHHYLQR